MASWQTASIQALGGETVTCILGLGGGKWVLCGTGGTIQTSADDALTWTSRTAASSIDLFFLARNPNTGRIVAGGDGGTSSVMYSDDDGHTWTGATGGEAGYAYISGCWHEDESRWALLGLNGVVNTSIITSDDDGATWSTQTSPDVLDASGGGIASSGSLLLVYPNAAAGDVMTSATGLTGDWTTHTRPATFTELMTGQGNNPVVWSDAAGAFMCAGYDTGTFATKFAFTVDGTSWTYTTLAAFSLGCSGAVAAEGINGFIASLPFDSGLSPTPTVIGSSIDAGATFTDEDTTFSGSWGPAGWSNDTGTVVFWDATPADTVLIGSFPVATITGLSPASGSALGGTVVTITGTGLTGVVTGDVLFDASAALSVTPAADGLSLTCITPTHAVGAVAVTVTGASGSLTYTYVSITRITPSRGPVQGGQDFTMTGFGFNAATGVLFDTTAATNVTIVSDTQITGTTPAHGSGAVSVTVVGVGTADNAYTYEIAVDPLDPLPYRQPVIDDNPGRMDINWFRTLNEDWRTRIENPVLGPLTVVPAENVVGVLNVDTIPDLPVTRIQFDHSPRLLGRSSAGAGDGEEIRIGPMFSMTGGVLNLFGTPGTFTQGSVIFAGPIGTLTQDNANLFWDDTDNRLLLGGGLAGPQLRVVGAFANINRIDLSNTSAADGARAGFIARSDTAQGLLDVFSSGTVASPVASLTGANLVWLRAVSTNAMAIGLANNSPIVFVTNALERMRIAAGGNVGVGVTGPTAVLHLKAGTTAASTAPLKFNSGSLMTAAEAGAMEFLTDDFYLTITTGTARKGILLNDGTALTATRVPFATTNGRLTDDADMTFAGDTLTVTKLLAPTSTSTPSLISTGAITITPNAGSNLNVSLSTTGDLAVNTNQLYVDTSAARVGINTSTPSQAVSVVGEMDFYAGATLRGIIGPSSWASNFFSFQNATLAESASNFGLTQDSNGATTVNSVTGQALSFRINNATKFMVFGTNCGIGNNIATTDFPGAGNAGLVFTDATALSSMASNTAGLYADDVSGTVHMFAIAEDGKTMQLTGAANNTLAVAVQDLIVQLGKVTKYNAITTAGWGVPAIYASARSTAQTAAVTSVATYTVGASDGSFIVRANINVTTSTTHNFTAAVDYTDETNTARTLTLTFSQLAGTLITAITNVTGAGPYEGIPLQIRCKASTAITIKTTGTFTSVTYNVEGGIEQVA